VVAGWLTCPAHEFEKDVIAALPTTGKLLFRPQPDLMRRTMSEMQDFVSPGYTDVVAGYVNHGAAGAYHACCPEQLPTNSPLAQGWGLRYNAFRNGFLEQTSRATDARIARKPRFDHARRAGCEQENS
jgi:hypothetical protein